MISPHPYKEILVFCFRMELLTCGCIISRQRILAIALTQTPSSKVLVCRGYSGGNRPCSGVGKMMADLGDCKRLGNRTLNTIKILVPIAGQVSRDNLLETVNPAAYASMVYTQSEKWERPNRQGRASGACQPCLKRKTRCVKTTDISPCLRCQISGDKCALNPYVTLFP